jgi:hypothetical protein
VHEVGVQNATTGELTLDVDDPDGQLVAVAFSRQSGAGAWSAEAVDPTAPYRDQVALDPEGRAPSAIAWTVRYLNPTDPAAPLELSGLWRFPVEAPRPPMPPPDLQLTIDAATGAASLVVVPRAAAAAVRAAGSTAGYPSQGATDAAAAASAAPYTFALGPVAAGGTMYARTRVDPADGGAPVYATAQATRGGGTSGGGGGMPARAVVTFTTPAVSPGAEVVGTFALPAGVSAADLVSTAASASGRLRVYGTAALRDDAAEAARAFLVDTPATALRGAVQHDVQLDNRNARLVATPSEPSALTSQDDPRTPTLYYRWRSCMDQPGAATITLTLTPKESA